LKDINPKDPEPESQLKLILPTYTPSLENVKRLTQEEQDALKKQ
jgi:hypothetical protein